jgi:hypothetical protein
MFDVDVKALQGKNAELPYVCFEDVKIAFPIAAHGVFAAGIHG